MKGIQTLITIRKKEPPGFVYDAACQQFRSLNCFQETVSFALYQFATDIIIDSSKPQRLSLGLL